MQLQARDIQALTMLAQYFMLTSRQLRQLCFHDDSTGRVTRRRMLKMSQDGLVRKRNLLVVNPRDGAASPVFHLTKIGREFLASHYDDELYLQKPVEPSQPQHLFHYVGVSDAQILLNEAIALQSTVTIENWVNEDEFVNPGEQDKDKRIKLLTQFPDGNKVVCAPDAAFLLAANQHRAVRYIELDRDSFYHDRVAARKTPGYKKLLATRSHLRHFPNSTRENFLVLFFAPTEKRARQLRDAFAKTNAGDKALEIYRFGSFETLTPENVLTAPVFRCCHHDNLVSLLKPSVIPDHASTAVTATQSSGTP